MESIWLFVIMAVVLMVTAVYSVQNRQKVAEDFTGEMKDLIQEAVLIKKDLEAMMENSLLISDDMIKNLDERLDKIENLAVGQAKSSANQAVNGIPERRNRRQLPFRIEDLRRAHPSIVVPRLFNDGYSIPEIAELLDRGQGEVRLILDVQKRREVSG